MTARAALAATALTLLSAGCAVGFGTPYPGVATRERYTLYRTIGPHGNVVTRQSGSTSPSGGGSRGLVLGMHFGSGRATFDGRESDSNIDIDLYGEYVHIFSGSFALAAGVGWDPAAAPYPEEDAELVVNGFPAYLKAIWHPLVPLAFHAGGGAEKYTATWRVNDADQGSAGGVGLHAFVGGGMTWFVGGIGVLFQLEWHHRRYGEVELGARTGELSHNALLYQAIVAW